MERAAETVSVMTSLDMVRKYCRR